MLDQFAARWQHQARDVCLATAVAGADELAARRTACLVRDRDVFVAIAERFAAADRALIGRAEQLLGALPDLDACMHADPPARPADPLARVRLAHHFAEVARVRSLAEAGQLDEAARRAEQLAGAASGLGVRRAEADASYLTGHIADLRGQFDEAARRVEQALWIAEATRYDELAATAASELVFLIGNRQRRPAEARRFVELARATAERLGSAAARARAARAIGNLELATGNVDAAGAALGEALALSQAMSPPDPMLTAGVLMNLANVDTHRGHHASAEQRLRQAAGTIAHELGELHPAHAQVLNHLGNTLLDLGRADEAAPVFDQVIAIQQRALGADR